MYIFPDHKRVLVLRCLIEGMSVLDVWRATRVGRPTVMRIGLQAGRAADMYQSLVFRDLPSRCVEVDAHWSFAYDEKRRTRPYDARRGPGDVWTWTAICEETKLALSWGIGDWSATMADEFMAEVRRRLAHRVQFASNGGKGLLTAIDGKVDAEAEEAALTRWLEQGVDAAGDDRGEGDGQSGVRREGPEDATAARGTRIWFRGRSGALSEVWAKKLANHADALALQFLYYNFCRIHPAVKTTPAIKAEVTDRFWELGDVVRLAKAGGREEGL